MTDGPDKIQISLFLTKPQLEGLDRVMRRQGVNRQSLIRLAIHAFLLTQDSIYRSNQVAEQPTDEAA